ncbi:hypothetical protein DVB69_01775 [Sporosarcina sp. BI001-red]|uniref:hypothetical protein n=1 Tax=Sporosarcina sp. BI001-red TaxID=2282866 RepID=UPI000E234776|nr:hypothetical protein [Sporosarcina sp. BI001-red]REB09564.1 hypothetical protein DVB69_01775 [Sporosarcina sp. BI001-red]
MVSIVEVVKEESTSIYWSGNAVEPLEQNEQKQEEIVPQQVIEATVDSPVVKRLRYLAEPFPRNAYRPLQFLVDGQLLTGGISAMTDSQIAIEVNQESKDLNEIRTLDLQKIEEVFWKGAPFT